MKWQKFLNITFLVLVSVWLFGTYKFSGTTNQTVTVPSSQLATNSPLEIVEVKDTATSTLATTTITKQPTPKPKTVVATKILVPPPAILAPEPPPDFESINTFARTALVNILCTTKGNELSPISGTGVIISPNGIVLTNAHVGQFFLLRDLYEKDYITCVIRTGSPAYPKYYAELAYISPTWVENNKTILKDQDPKGTGENDFAFLHITSSVDSGTKLPDNFPYLTPNISEDLKVSDPVILVSYPAGFLGGLSILEDLDITSSITTIQDIFTFDKDTVDLINVGGTVVSQRGSSGGAVVDRHSGLIGIISTSSLGDTTSSSDLNAITIPYINRTLKNESGLTLSDFLSQDISAFAKDFQTTIAPRLTKLISDVLTANQ